MPTANDLTIAGALFVELWGAGYLVIGLTRALKRRNQKPTGGQNQP
ncbi:hypothetical protein QRB41_12745 [Mycobacterium avium subsp. hominissuis]|nr:MULTISPECIES: hypothetical protein [Mycobacteriaceae]MDO2384265.1 hypothetical protein [Mycobacterium avium subsp. hominissuis]MDO2395363.1 hypothetical protein [Mycobacterium avium subsp. hominissuis]